MLVVPCTVYINRLADWWPRGLSAPRTARRIPIAHAAADDVVALKRSWCYGTLLRICQTCCAKSPTETNMCDDGSDEQEEDMPCNSDKVAVEPTFSRTHLTEHITRIQRSVKIPALSRLSQYFGSFMDPVTAKVSFCLCQ